MAGLYFAPKLGDKFSQELAFSVKSDIEKKLNRRLGIFYVHSYCKQNLNNYKLKIRTDSGEFLHAVVHKPLSGKLRLTSVKRGMSLQDPIII